MKKILLTIIIASTTSLCAYAQAYNTESFDVVAPTVADNADAPKQVGSIIYNLVAGSFYGLDNTGNWVPISASTTTAGLFSYSSGYTALTNTNAWQNLQTLSLSPGTWEITGSVTYLTTAVTSAGDMLVAISEYSEDTTTDHVEGLNFFGTATNSGSQLRTNITLTKITLVNSSTSNKSYYFKTRKDNGGANINKSWRVVAQKIK